MKQNNNYKKLQSQEKILNSLKKLKDSDLEKMSVLFFKYFLLSYGVDKEKDKNLIRKKYLYENLKNNGVKEVTIEGLCSYLEENIESEIFVEKFFSSLTQIASQSKPIRQYNGLPFLFNYSEICRKQLERIGLGNFKAGVAEKESLSAKAKKRARTYHAKNLFKYLMVIGAIFLAAYYLLDSYFYTAKEIERSVPRKLDQLDQAKHTYLKAFKAGFISQEKYYAFDKEHNAAREALTSLITVVNDDPEHSMRKPFFLIGQFMLACSILNIFLDLAYLFYQKHRNLKGIGGMDVIEKTEGSEKFIQHIKETIQDYIFKVEADLLEVKKQSELSQRKISPTEIREKTEIEKDLLSINSCPDTFFQPQESFASTSKRKPKKTKTEKPSRFPSIITNYFSPLHLPISWEVRGEVVTYDPEQYTQDITELWSLKPGFKKYNCTYYVKLDRNSIQSLIESEVGKEADDYLEIVYPLAQSGHIAGYKGQGYIDCKREYPDTPFKLKIHHRNYGAYRLFFKPEQTNPEGKTLLVPTRFGKEH